MISLSYNANTTTNAKITNNSFYKNTKVAICNSMVPNTWSGNTVCYPNSNLFTSCTFSLPTITFFDDCGVCAGNNSFKGPIEIFNPQILKDCALVQIIPIHLKVHFKILKLKV